jgi:uncharacterized membrane protein YraQ (UPF0718 family)
MSERSLIYTKGDTKLNISTILLIVGVLLALGWSFIRDKKKTMESMTMARGLFFKTAGEIIGILALIGLFLTLVPQSAIRALLGGPNAFLSGLYGAIVGAITILPAFVAFPLAGSLVQRGAHLIAVAAFLTTLTMVGFVTMPIEIEHFGKKFAIVRNVASFIAALIIAGGMVIFL